MHNSVATYEFKLDQVSLETLNLGENWLFLSCVTLKFDRWRWKTIGHFYATSSFVHHFIAICEFKLDQVSLETLNLGENWLFLSCVTLKFDRWRWKTIGHFYATSSFVHHFIAICEFKLELWSGNAQIGGKICFHPGDLDLWPWTQTSLLSMAMTPENFRTIQWQKHCQKGVTDRRTGTFIELLGSILKSMG